NGSWAAKGNICASKLERWLRHPYFFLKPPKSTGRELFGEPFFRAAMRDLKNAADCDIIATFTEFTARSLALNYEKHLPAQVDRIILTGGGASNPVLVNRIASQFP